MSYKRKIESIENRHTDVSSLALHARMHASARRIKPTNKFILFFNRIYS